MRGDEERVVDAFCRWLGGRGWKVDREVEFADVVATKDGRTLYAEAKGRTAVVGLDVDTMYGQILRRMPFDENPNAAFAVVVPEEAVEAALRVKDRVRELLGIRVFGVDAGGTVRELGSGSRRDENSRRTRVEPVFGWLALRREDEWAAGLVGLADGLGIGFDPGPFRRARIEVGVPPSNGRLRWLEGVVPTEVQHGGPLEGATYADCVIECEQALIWIEGKRNDWLSSGTTWDDERDQLARNLEAASILADERAVDFCVLICHEVDLRSDERRLVDGYRSGSLVGGLQHLADDARRRFSDRIGTVTWSQIVNEWPGLRADPRLTDVA